MQMGWEKYFLHIANEGNLPLYTCLLYIYISSHERKKEAASSQKKT